MNDEEIKKARKEAEKRLQGFMNNFERKRYRVETE